MLDEKVNRDNFGQLYDKYIKKIFNFIYYKTHHKETAEDLTSDTFIKALNKLDRFDESKGSFSTWIYQIARNTVIDFYRTKKNSINIDDIWDLSTDEDILRDLDTAKRLEDVKEYLKTLKSEQREIVILRVWEGMSYKEISEAMGKSEASCKMAFSRTIKILKEQMPLSVFVAMLLF
ncbi:MAG: RNA polymerase sigma factor [Candidatus Nealsonbacteria bacterium]